MTNQELVEKLRDLEEVKEFYEKHLRIAPSVHILVLQALECYITSIKSEIEKDTQEA